MEVDADIFPHADRMRGPFVGSLILHGCLFVLALFGYLIPQSRGESWGGTTAGGGAMSATLVNSIPLPHAQPEQQNVLANESKGLAQSVPKETPKEQPKAIPIPERESKRKGQHESTQKKPPPPQQVAKADNQVPFGQGGPVSGPYNSFTVGNGKAGFDFNSGGDFGSRFAWYVDGMRRKVTESWSQVNPNIATARKVYLYFEINRSGQPTNIRVEQSSGVPAVDISAVRALQRIDTFGPLPGEYSGRYVAVEYWFSMQ